VQPFIVVVGQTAANYTTLYVSLGCLIAQPLCLVLLLQLSESSMFLFCTCGSLLPIK